MPDSPSSLKPQWFQILLALADHDLHGTGIMEEVLERTEGQMKLWPGTLYGSLHKMADRGLILETDPPDGAWPEGGNPRFYRITPEGRRALREAAERMAGYVRAAAAKDVLKEPESA